MDLSDLDPCRTPVHEPRVDEPLVAEPRVPVSSSKETRVPESSSHVTPGTSDHGDGVEETLSEDSYSEGELVEEGKKVYQHGGTKLPSVPATHHQRWLIQPNREK